VTWESELEAACSAYPDRFPCTVCGKPAETFARFAAGNMVTASAVHLACLAPLLERGLIELVEGGSVVAYSRSGRIALATAAGAAGPLIDETLTALEDEAAEENNKQ
jgi:hypothetical protein